MCITLARVYRKYMFLGVFGLAVLWLDREQSRSNSVDFLDSFVL